MTDINLLTHAIPSEFGRKFEICNSLDDGASLRKYWHLKSERGNFILSFQGENLEKYIQFSKLYNEFDISVPEIFWIDHKERLILMEYLDQNFHLFSRNECITQFYSLIKEFIHAIQSIPHKYFTRSFNNEIFDMEWENLIVPKVIGNHNIDFWEDSIFPRLKNVFDSAEKPGHRDLQSSNLFLKNDKLFFIDFQDSMLIHPFYDIASCFWDSYVDVDFNERYKLSYEVSVTIFDDFENVAFLWVLLQRKLHDIGAFIRAVENGKDNFINYIRNTKEMCNWIIKELDIKLDMEILWKNSLIQKY